jgi:hypothetical protein
MVCFSLLVYDVTKRETFTNLAEVWTKEIEANSTNKDCVKMLVGNKVDKVLFLKLNCYLLIWNRCFLIQAFHL